MKTLEQSTYYVDISLVLVSLIGLSSVDTPLGELALSSLKWGGLHR
jgi:hypothetical protein